MPRVAMNALTRSLVITSPLTRPTPAPNSSTTRIPSTILRFLAVHRLGRQDRAEAHDPADREIERSAEDHQRLPRGDDAERDGAHEHLPDVVDAQELARAAVLSIETAITQATKTTARTMKTGPEVVPAKRRSAVTRRPPDPAPAAIRSRRRARRSPGT